MFQIKVLQCNLSPSSIPVGPTARAGGAYGPGMPSQSIYSVSLNCNGTEETLFDCPSTPASGCTHVNDAGLECNATRKSHPPPPQIYSACGHRQIMQTHLEIHPTLCSYVCSRVLIIHLPGNFLMKSLLMAICNSFHHSNRHLTASLVMSWHS